MTLSGPGGNFLQNVGHVLRLHGEDDNIGLGKNIGIGAADCDAEALA